MPILVGQVDFDHLLVCGQVMKFDISTTLQNVLFHRQPDKTAWTVQADPTV